MHTIHTLKLKVFNAAVCEADTFPSHSETKVKIKRNEKKGCVIPKVPLRSGMLVHHLLLCWNRKSILYHALFSLWLYISHRERERGRERNLLDSFFFFFFLIVDGASTIIREERPEKKTGTTRRTIPTRHTDLPSSHRRRSRRRSLRRQSTRFNSPFIFLIQRIR